MTLSPDPTGPEPPTSLAQEVERGWDQHARQPQSVVQALMARAPQVVADPAGAAAIALAEHVWLAHLQDEAGLARFLQALAPQGLAGHEPWPADIREALRRSHWVLGRLTVASAPTTAGAEPADPPSPAARWRGLQNVWSVQAARGAAEAARLEVLAECAAALAHPAAADRKALAAACNNLAVDLREGRRGDAALDALMLAAAAASRTLWGDAGTWLQQERAEYQLARCHAVLGQAEPALDHARACLAIIEAQPDPQGAAESLAFERFFAHEALGWAWRADAGHGAEVAQQRAMMARLRDAITDADLRGWADAALAEFDAPAG